jgi:hypothetical protein
MKISQFHMKKYKLSLLIIFLGSFQFTSAHSLDPSPIDYSEKVTKAMCDKTPKIKESYKGIREIISSASNRNNEVRDGLRGMVTDENKLEIEQLVEDNREMFSESYNRSFMIGRLFVDILESACMGDDGYYWIKKNNSKLKEYIDIYNKSILAYNKFLTEELLPKVEQIQIKKYEK